MYDLVWVGNTLYPRWFVFVAGFGLLYLSILLISVSVASIVLGIGRLFGKFPPD